MFSDAKRPREVVPREYSSQGEKSKKVNERMQQWCREGEQRVERKDQVSPTDGWEVKGLWGTEVDLNKKYMFAYSTPEIYPFKTYPKHV